MRDEAGIDQVTPDMSGAVKKSDSYLVRGGNLVTHNHMRPRSWVYFIPTVLLLIVNLILRSCGYSVAFSA